MVTYTSKKRSSNGFIELMKMSIWSAVLMLFTRRVEHRVLLTSGRGRQQARKYIFSGGLLNRINALTSRRNSIQNKPTQCSGSMVYCLALVY